MITAIKSFIEKYLMLLIGIAVGLAVGVGFGYLWKSSSTAKAATKAELKEYKAGTEKMVSAIDTLEEKRNERQKTYKRIADSAAALPPNRNECFDADRLRIANEALQATTRKDADKPGASANATGRR